MAKIFSKATLNESHKTDNTFILDKVNQILLLNLN